VNDAQELSVMLMFAAKLGVEPVRRTPPERSMANRKLDARLDIWTASELMKLKLGEAC
jgi:hypothetical protein